MKGRPVDQLVYEYLFPNATSNDPHSFHAFLQRCLIMEVRSEVHSFYGHLDTQEAKYPGLDYSNKIHRIRLSRWKWHRRLFRAFDALGLTANEIANLTKWEGTKWAKDRYEQEQGIRIRDTASDGMPHWGHLQDKPTPYARPSRYMVDPSVQHPTKGDEQCDDDDDDDDEEDEDEEDYEDEQESDDEEEMVSVGVELNERLRAQAARREAGDRTAVMDEEWEQWLKNALETGEMPMATEHMYRHRPQPPHNVPPELVPARMLNAARTGNWHEIPEALHSTVRNILNLLASRGQLPDEIVQVPSRRPVSPSAGIRRHFAMGQVGDGWRRPF
jgi:hypothetical protein